MKRSVVLTAAVAGVLTLGMTGALMLASSAGAAPLFLTGGSHAAAPAVAPNARVEPGSVWTLKTPIFGCNIETFSSGNVVTSDAGFSGTWTKPTTNTIKLVFPGAPEKYKGTYSKTSGGYTGKLSSEGSSIGDTTLTPGATSGC
jgi:hypothetical protein